MAAYHQEVRKLEEKFDGFELHHILQGDSEAADALTRLGSSHEQSPLGMFVQDLVKLSIRLDEDSPSLVPGTPPGEGNLAPPLETDPGTTGRPTGQAWEPRSEVATITEPSDSDSDW
jgi:hypothetical protein